MTKFEELMAAQRELTAKMANANEEEMKALEREFNNNKREMELLNLQSNHQEEREMGKSIVALIRENKGKEFQLQMRSGEFTTGQGYGAGAIDKNVQAVVDPVYANSTLAAAGAKFYTNLPYGNIAIPVLGKGSVGWKAEVAAASAAGNTITPVELTPNRLTAFIDISNVMLAQDTHEVCEAIKRDLINAVYEKLEATILGDAAASNSPAGMFYGQTIADGTTWANACDIEATVEANNYTKNVTYILSPAAKADFRKMKYSGNTGAGVWGGNEVDGTPAQVTSNVKAGAYIVGDFSNLAIGLWGGATVHVDDKSQLINGCTRLVVELFADAKVLRAGAFKYGRTRTLAQG